MSSNQILDKESIKRSILEGLAKEPEIDRILIFGSFLFSETPNDLDIAIFQNSDQNYLSLALKYRKLLRKEKSIPQHPFRCYSRAIKCYRRVFTSNQFKGNYI